MKKTRILTGITTTGIPHLGNYVGAIRPTVIASKNKEVESFYFLADYHALIKSQDSQRINESRLEIAATWIAAGLDVENAVFYRQSDLPEILQLTWLLSCICAKGLMNRAHAYKAALAENQANNNEDLDAGISMGLFSYPVLMAADILMFNADLVPVGRDQIQHLEMARDLAQRFNFLYKKEFFTLPEAQIDDRVAVLNGLDGRKMSKSYDNTIPLFVDEKKLLKLVRKIKTNSLEPGEPKDPNEGTLMQIYTAFATEAEIADLKAKYLDGISWGEVKNILFEKLNSDLSEAREKYYGLILRPDYIEDILQTGAKKARAIAAPFMQELREAVGIKNFN